VAVVAQEVHAAAAVVTVDLAGVALTGIGPVLGAAEVGIPKLRTGSFLPELLEPRRRVDRALWAVIMTAYITGTSTRKGDDLVKALGCESGITKSTVSRICAQIDADAPTVAERLHARRASADPRAVLLAPALAHRVLLRRSRRSRRNDLNRTDRHDVQRFAAHRCDRRVPTGTSMNR
jgi:hypothetical protein